LLVGIVWVAEADMAVNNPCGRLPASSNEGGVGCVPFTGIPLTACPWSAAGVEGVTIRGDVALAMGDCVLAVEIVPVGDVPAVTTLSGASTPMERFEPTS
jgi:hypothetical protein